MASNVAFVVHLPPHVIRTYVNGYSFANGHPLHNGTYAGILFWKTHLYGNDQVLPTTI
jgi:hypothetical protein